MTSNDDQERVSAREQLLDGAADLFRLVTLDDLVQFVGPKRVAEHTDKSKGTISHHFPAGSNLGVLALQRALDFVPPTFTDLQLVEELGGALSGLAEGRTDKLDTLKLALANEMAHYSPDDPKLFDPKFEANEVVFYLAGAAAIHDPRAQEMIYNFMAPHRELIAGATEKILHEFRLRWRDGIDAQNVALTMNALAVGFSFIRRFARELAPRSLYADMAVRVFTSCTIAEGDVEEDSDDELVASFRDAITTADAGKQFAIVNAAEQVINQSGIEKMSVAKVAARASVARATVVSHFGSRDGLCGAVWLQRHLSDLRQAHQTALDADVDRATCLRLLLTALARAGGGDPALTAGMLRGSIDAVADGPFGDRSLDLRQVVDLVVDSIVRTESIVPSHAVMQRDIDRARMVVHGVLRDAVDPSAQDAAQLGSSYVDFALS